MLGAQGEAVAEAELCGAAHRPRSSGGLLTRRARGQGAGSGLCPVLCVLSSAGFCRVCEGNE